MTHPSATVLFDGHCNLCNGAVVFIIRRDRQCYFNFASLQSEAAIRLLKSVGVEQVSGDSIILIETGKVYDRSTAALRIAKKLNRLWPLLYIFIIIPSPLRDAIYSWIARNRYRWFGRREECMVPDSRTKIRFIE
jgi:predicted DCC family thiol-disulfide oxidoreductase YuxK